MPRSSTLAKPRNPGGRPRGSTGYSQIRLREVLINSCTAKELTEWFRKGLTPKERLDLLAKLEPKEVTGAGGGPILVSWME